MIVTRINCSLACFYTKWLFWIISIFLWMFEKMNPPKIYSYYEAMVSLFWLKLVMIVTCMKRSGESILFADVRSLTIRYGYMFHTDACLNILSI